MRILIVGINFSPELTGIGKYTGEMVEWLSGRGHDVRVICAPPYYPNWRVAPGYSSIRYQVEHVRGATIIRCPVWVPVVPGGLKRILHLASFALSSAPVVLGQWRWKPDVVWVVEPALFCAPMASLFARIRRTSSWLHIQDYEIDAAFELGMLKGPTIRRYIAGIERLLMRTFRRVSTISDRMLDIARQKGVPPESLKSFPNWVDLESIQPLRDLSGYRAEVGIPAGAIVALYSGNMGGKQGLEILAGAANLCQHIKNLVFVFCGDGAGRIDLERSCLKFKNVFFLSLQPVDRLNELLGMADIHLLPQRADAADLVMPSKLTGMLASGRPVVATAHPNTQLGSVVAQVGLIVEPGDVSAFANAIQALADDATERLLMGAKARQYAEDNLDRESILKRFENDLFEMVQEQR